MRISKFYLMVVGLAFVLIGNLLPQKDDTFRTSGLVLAILGAAIQKEES